MRGIVIVRVRRSQLKDTGCERERESERNRKEERR